MPYLLQGLSLPFVLTNDYIGSISDTTEMWIGQFDVNMTSPWIDLFIAMVTEMIIARLHAVTLMIVALEGFQSTIR
jgi:hypothetical protein